MEEPYKYTAEFIKLKNQINLIPIGVNYMDR
jgi:hypothetical protein